MGAGKGKCLFRWCLHDSNYDTFSDKRVICLTRLLSAYPSGYIVCSFTFYSGNVHCVLTVLCAGARHRGSGVSRRDAVFTPMKLIP